MNFIVENWYLFVLAFVSGGMLFLPMLKSGANGLTPSAAVLLVNREKAVLIDVCEPAEYAAGHAVGAKSVPLGSLAGSADLPKNKAVPVVLICASGARAGRAAALLRKAGHEHAHVLAGGLAAWREANLPVEKSA